MRHLVQEIFVRLREGPSPTEAVDPGRSAPACAASLPRVVEHMVDRISQRLRAVPGYAKTLQSPLLTLLHHIDGMVDSVPDPIRCSCDTFTEDPRVNAFFVGPSHLQEVFSRTEEVWRLFEADGSLDECWALLCMENTERVRPGMALVDGHLHRDVMQTRVSFSDHQVVAPGRSEADARQALKCCIFDCLLGFLRERIEDARQKSEHLEAQIRVLRARLSRLGDGAEAKRQRIQLQVDLSNMEGKLAGLGAPMSTIADQLRYLVGALENPHALLSAVKRPLRLSRLGVQIDKGSEEPGYEIELFEIRIASRRPRIATLVRFPRRELLPQQDFLDQADLFLSLDGRRAHP